MARYTVLAAFLAAMGCGGPSSPAGQIGPTPITPVDGTVDTVVETKDPLQSDLARMFNAVTAGRVFETDSGYRVPGRVSLLKKEECGSGMGFERLAPPRWVCVESLETGMVTSPIVEQGTVALDCDQVASQFPQFAETCLKMWQGPRATVTGAIVEFHVRGTFLDEEYDRFVFPIQ